MKEKRHELFRSYHMELPILCSFRGQIQKNAIYREIKANAGKTEAVMPAKRGNYLTNLTAVPYTITSAAPCITAEDA